MEPHICLFLAYVGEERQEPTSPKGREMWGTDSTFLDHVGNHLKCNTK